MAGSFFAGMTMTTKYNKPIAYHSADHQARLMAEKAIKQGQPIGPVIRDLRAQYAANLELWDVRNFKAVQRLRVKADAVDLGKFARKILDKA